MAPPRQSSPSCARRFPRQLMYIYVLQGIHRHITQRVCTDLGSKEEGEVASSASLFTIYTYSAILSRAGVAIARRSVRWLMSRSLVYIRALCFRRQSCVNFYFLFFVLLSFRATRVYNSECCCFLIFSCEIANRRKFKRETCVL